MVDLLSRFLLIIAGFIAGWFVSKDALKFEVYQFTIAVLLFTFIILIAAFYPSIVLWFKKNKKK